MNTPHRIRLRGGWNLVASGVESPWSLPCTGAALAGAGADLRLIRRFNHPPVRTEGQACRLVIRKVAGVVGLDCDGSRFTAVMPVTDHPEAGFDFEIPVPESGGHRLELFVETANLEMIQEWGEIWLEIVEPG